MDASVADTLRRRTGLAPLVRATHSDLEVACLPPYGDPEVNIPGEVATYAIAGGLAAGVLDILAE